MKIQTLPATVLLVAAVGGVFVWVLSRSVDRSISAKPCTANIIGLTNGRIGPMSATYQTFSTNTAAAIQRWLSDGTNAAVVRVTNSQNCAIWIFPFVRIHSRSNSSAIHESLHLDAPNFSGIRLAAGQATNMQVATFALTDPWRIEVGYTRERGNSFVERVLNLPRDLLAVATGRGIVENTTPIHTDWIQP